MVYIQRKFNSGHRAYLETGGYNFNAFITWAPFFYIAPKNFFEGGRAKSPTKRVASRPPSASTASSSVAPSPAPVQNEANKQSTSQNQQQQQQQQPPKRQRPSELIQNSTSATMYISRNWSMLLCLFSWFLVLSFSLSSPSKYQPPDPRFYIFIVFVHKCHWFAKEKKTVFIKSVMYLGVFTAQLWIDNFSLFPWTKFINVNYCECVSVASQGIFLPYFRSCARVRLDYIMVVPPWLLLPFQVNSCFTEKSA